MPVIPLYLWLLNFIIFKPANMKTLLLSTVLLCSFVTAFAQEDDSRFAVGLQVSPDYAHHESWPALFDATAPKLGYSGSLFGEYTLGQKWMVQLGVGYANKGAQAGWYGTDTIWPPTPGSVSVKKIFSYHFLEVPAKLSFLLKEGRTRVSLSGGCSFNLTLAASRTDVSKVVNAIISRETIPSSTANLQPFTLAMLLGVGIDHDISDSWTLRLQPEMRHDFTRLTTSPEQLTEWSQKSHRYLNSAGVNVGIIRQL